MPKRVLAVVAHPDDIEFMMSGTLILLHDAGYEIHYMTVANGSCGSLHHDAAATATLRRQESIDAAAVIDAVYHESLCDDLEIFFERPLLARLAALVRTVAPEIVLTHPPQDYMEDHMNTCRLVLGAAFARTMPNYQVTPPQAPVGTAVAVYHALPYGLRDPLGRRAEPAFYVDISGVLVRKRQMLAMHRSQKEWLDVTQGIDAYLSHMETMSADVGKMSGRFAYAEGWTRHLMLGYGDEAFDPLHEALAEVTIWNETWA